MSLLPQQILPPDTPLATVENGQIIISKQWWLLLYNLCLKILGTTGSPVFDPTSIQLDATTDDDVMDSDAVVLRRAIANNAAQAIQGSDVVVSTDDLPDLQRALLLAQDPPLPDPTALAQPVSTVTPTGSPFTYTAPYAGVVTFTAVSTVSLIRQGTTVNLPNNLGTIGGAISLARYDQIKVSYSSTPTMMFFPWSSQ